MSLLCRHLSTGWPKQEMSGQDVRLRELADTIPLFCGPRSLASSAVGWGGDSPSSDGLAHDNVSVAGHAGRASSPPGLGLTAEAKFET